jgi:dihydrodipicolinate synthase/N-acetylneuraminate lyase
MNWQGVIPAITTPFTEALRIDSSFLTQHCRWLLDNGCAGIVSLGSLGERAFELYRWFLPLLRMDTVPAFVQLIQLVQQQIGMGSVRVRAPRLELVGDELRAAKKIISDALASKPHAAGSYALPN